jgi:hypothetical protein
MKLREVKTEDMYRHRATSDYIAFNLLGELSPLLIVYSTFGLSPAADEQVSYSYNNVSIIPAASGVL